MVVDQKFLFSETSLNIWVCPLSKTGSGPIYMQVNQIKSRYHIYFFQCGLNPVRIIRVRAGPDRVWVKFPSLITFHDFLTNRLNGQRLLDSMGSGDVLLRSTPWCLKFWLGGEIEVVGYLTQQMEVSFANLYIYIVMGICVGGMSFESRVVSVECQKMHIYKGENRHFTFQVLLTTLTFMYLTFL